ncbi:eukaryotic translation initiation factor 4H [Drosophila subobscura]|uniref:eukaryotic translation initiation factor 4H n=1 Tax=Drosophila subobscura TaxID=7241 RepID=UPI00155AE5E0|nr:eukaryotic translation initiation factor 4H [Drosophila subobscura]
MSKSQSYKKSKSSSSAGSLEDFLSVTKLRISDEDKEDSSCQSLDAISEQSAPSEKLPQVDVPLHPPFVALISNLPMESSERELRQLFAQHTIRSVSMLRRGKRQRQRQRQHGAAQLELQTRQDLLELLKKNQLLCRGRRLSITVCQDLGAGGDDCWSMHSDGRWSRRSASGGRHSGSDADESCSEHSLPSRGEESTSSPLHISRKPSSNEELERRMQIRLQKLAEFENAQTERLQAQQQSSQGEEGEAPSVPSMSWPDFWAEVQKSEDLE